MGEPFCTTRQLGALNIDVLPIRGIYGPQKTIFTLFLVSHSFEKQTLQSS